ncbi:MAG: IS256 family transposase [Gemmatimonadaceae bacterium]
MTKRKKDSDSGIRADVLDELLGKNPTAEDVDTLYRDLKKAILERALGAELTHHLGYEKGEEKPEDQANYRNGTTPKTVLTDDGEVPLEIPRDRAGSFTPRIIPKGMRRLPGFDSKVLSLYARGMTVREIQGHLEELYGVNVSPDLISTVTDAVLEEVTAWQQRPLDRLYPVVMFDCLRVKIRDEGVVKSKAVYVVLGVTREGTKDVLGLWIEQTEGAAFWLRVMSEIKNRGVDDILIVLVDGLTGFAEALEVVFPKAQMHHCIVHLVRRSLSYVSWADKKEVAKALRSIYRAPTAEAARAELDAFVEGPCGRRFPPIVAMWRRHWEHVEPVFTYPASIRRLLYTTNAIESLHMQLRKIIKNRGHFPNDEAATKLLYLALRNIISKWKNAAPAWQAALTHFSIIFGDRFAPED